MRMDKAYSFIFFLLLILGLTSCVTTGAHVGPALQPGDTGVYISRDKISASNPDIYLDGKLLGTLENHGRLSSHLQPGTHHLHINKGFFLNYDVDYDFSVKRGQIVYIQMVWGFSGGSHMAAIGGVGPMMMPNQNWMFTIVNKTE